ncbi:MAG: OB-fold domain-containing protein [Betaproteobacteria bacterium]|nr:OB-fold domain-containing protein [Betaproteobacteria bacterium]
MNGGLFRVPQAPQDKPYLLGSRCGECGYTSFPATQVCPVCLKPRTMKDVPLSRRGKIHTFAISMIGTSQHKAPYVQAYVDLPEGPRVFAAIVNCPPTPEAVRAGMAVELVLGPVGEDEEHNEIIGYQFQPVGT